MSQYEYQRPAVQQALCVSEPWMPSSNDCSAFSFTSSISLLIKSLSKDILRKKIILIKA